MMQTLMEKTPSLRKLDPEVSAQVLKRLIEGRAPLFLRATVDGLETTWSGAIAGADRSRLALKMDDLDSQSLAIVTSSILEATVTLDSAHYSFQTQRVGEVRSGQAGVIQVRRPASIYLIERRRSPRRRLRKPCEVTLRTTGQDTKWQCRGAMLNLSPEGIACRVGRQDAERIGIGQTLIADFRIVASPEAFQLSSQVVSLTPGSTADHIIVGMEFIDGLEPLATKARLQAALEVNE